MHDRLDPEFLRHQRRQQVRAALNEDLGITGLDAPDASRDLTAQLVGAETWAQATIISREPLRVCGQDWVNAVFAELDTRVQIEWLVDEGEDRPADTLLCRMHGPARSLLTGERSALNFLQTLSATATQTRNVVAHIPAGSRLKLLDTRKTLPGLRAAQKYAVGVGGGHNHRIGLFDAFLIKENHIAACGSIKAAVSRARVLAPAAPVEVEVENFEELALALAAGTDIIMLDEFADRDLPAAVSLNAGRAKLEVSGSVSPERLALIAAAGIDYVSMGSLSKHVQAIDLSMRVQTG